MNILVINGPNINMLGLREPEIYGAQTYRQLVEFIMKTAEDLESDSQIGMREQLQVEVYQSNVEGFIVDKIQKAFFEGVDGIIINPAAYTHTSIAIRDALKAVAIPAIEVHLSDISKREDYRQKSYISDIAIATIIGKGFAGYAEALEIFAKSCT